MGRKRKAESCNACNGEGLVKGAFKEFVCAGCNGLGVLVDGKALTEDEVILNLRVSMRKLAVQIALLKQNQKDEPAEPYKGSGRYKGD